jgi:hypothetical protein
MAVTEILPPLPPQLRLIDIPIPFRAIVQFLMNNEMLLTDV